MWLLLIAIVSPLLGIAILMASSRAKSAEVEGRLRGTAIALRVLSGVVLATGSAMVVVCALNLVGWNGGATTATAAAASAAAAALLLPAGVLLIVLSLDLTGDRLHSQWFRPVPLRRMLALAGYGLSLLPTFLLFPPLGGAVAAILLVIVAHARWDRDRSLLQLLTIAVERRFPLADELEASAGALDRQSAVPLLAMAEELRAGGSLPDVLAAHPRVIPPSVALAARVGEQTGTLAASLRTATDSVTEQRWQASRIAYLGSVVTYLWIAAIVFVGIFGFCMYYIVPKHKAILDDFGMALPSATILIIRVSDFVVETWFLTVPLGLALLAASVMAVECYRRGWSTLSLPWLTRWWPRLDTPDILRNLSRTVETGTPLPGVLQTLADYHHRPHIRERLKTARELVERGGDVWSALQTAGLLEEPEAQLLQSAGRAGNLPWALRDLADRQDRRRTERLIAWGEILRPWPVLLLGLAAAVFVLGMFLPLIDVIEGLS